MSSGRSTFFFDTCDISQIEDSRVTESGDTNEDDDDICYCYKAGVSSSDLKLLQERKGQRKESQYLPTLFSELHCLRRYTPPRYNIMNEYGLDV